MKRQKLKILFVISILLAIGLESFTTIQTETDKRFVTYTVDSKQMDVQLYWKNDEGLKLKSFKNLKGYLESKQKALLFAMNAGMYTKDYSPQGLFIQNNKTLNPIDTSSSGYGNFYLMPNGVFCITTDGIAKVCKSTGFVNDGKISYATQSGPLLVTNGQIHSAFIKGSTNLNIRNGVGILPNNQILFAMSKKEINFYDFATFFKNMGCENALYLDGFVSRTYLPEKNWIQMEGNFGVIIGVTKRD